MIPAPPTATAPSGRSDPGLPVPAALPIRATTLTEQCYQYLKDAILSLDLRPGAPLSELQLAGQFGISKSPVREALQRLARDGLVILEPNRRCLVAGLDVQTVRDWYELRLILEPASLRRTAATISPATLAFLSEITRLALAAVEQGDARAFIHNSDLFHLTLIDQNPNSSLVSVVHDLFDKVRRVRVALYQADQADTLRKQRHRTRLGLEHHETIIAALAAGELERAVELLAADIASFIDLLDEGHLVDALARVAVTR